ncbi:MAG: hypothetical protein IPN86_04440 [Saprospiraceae bacterium]|nr:hypothetical protein [Saprospiraceae bacterium]
MGNLVTDQTIDVTTSQRIVQSGIKNIKNLVRMSISAGSYVDMLELIHNCACTSGCSTNDIYNK